MKHGVHILVVALLVTVASALVGMRLSGNAEKTPAHLGNIPQRTNTSNDHLVDTAVSLLRSGYVALRMGLGADSRLLAQFNRKDKSYSHCGIVMVENGEPWVYHSIGGEDNPDARLRRDPAKLFFSPQHNSALAVVKYDLNNDQLNSLCSVVADYYKRRPKFDLKFDLKTDDKLYCAEFVYKAFNKATGDSTYIQPTSAAGITFVGTDNLFVNPHARIVWQTAFK